MGVGVQLAKNFKMSSGMIQGCAVNTLACNVLRYYIYYPAGLNYVCILTKSGTVHVCVCTLHVHTHTCISLCI